MRVTFLGVGEAFDPDLANTSILIESGETSMILDCGFSAGLLAWRYADTPLDIDALYISHFHGDHFYGIPAFLARSAEDGRTKTLRIIGQKGVGHITRQAVQLAYPGVLEKMQFAVEYIECHPQRSIDVHDMRCSFAASNHPMPCLSIRLDHAGRSLFYSGDGGATDDAVQLAHGADLCILESYAEHGEVRGHGTVADSIDFAKKVGASYLRCVHVNRKILADRKSEIRNRLTNISEFDADIPDSGDVVYL